jgi:hypothetical protein
VNKRQKIFTLVFLLLFVGTLLFCPWYCGGKTWYWPVFVNYCATDSYIVWSQLVLWWLALAVIYTGLHSTLK